MRSSETEVLSSISWISSHLLDLVLIVMDQKAAIISSMLQAIGWRKKGKNVLPSLLMNHLQIKLTLLHFLLELSHT